MIFNDIAQDSQIYLNASVRIAPIQRRPVKCRILFVDTEGEEPIALEEHRAIDWTIGQDLIPHRDKHGDVVMGNEAGSILRGLVPTPECETAYVADGYVTSGVKRP